MITVPTPSPAITFVMEAIKRTAGFHSVDTSNPVHLYYEAQEWVAHGFAPQEAEQWLREGFDSLAYLAAKLRAAGLSPRQAGCALADNHELLTPGFSYDEEDEFVRRALPYRKCCLGR